jgi:5'-phosphate synthase pdxT subunit
LVDAQPPADDPPRLGVLALQGGYAAHARVLAELGAEVREVRVPADLEGLDGLVMPGGESTTMSLGVEREGLAEPLRAFASAGNPVLGTCAGLIMLDRDHLGLMDTLAQRNAFGRQVRSFEADLSFAHLHGGPVHAVFIRAPWIAEHGPDVEVLAEVDGHPVAARQGELLVLSFHPELGDDTRLHAAFVDRVRELRGRAR